SFQLVDLRRRTGLDLVYGDVALGLQGHGMPVADLDNRQIAVRQGGLFETLEFAAELKFIGPHAEGHRPARFFPGARAGVEIHSAAIGNEPGLDFGVRRAEDDGVVAEIRIDIAGRRQEVSKKLVTRTIWL